MNNDSVDFSDLLGILKDKDKLDDLERSFLLVCMGETKQGQLYSDTVCYKNPETSYVHKDFSDPYRNVIALCIKEWRRLCKDNYQELNMEGIGMMVQHLASSHPELVTLSELKDVQEEWKAVKKDGESLLGIARNELLMLEWLKRARAEKAISDLHFKLTRGSKLNIDSLVDRLHKDVSQVDITSADELKTGQMSFSEVMKQGKSKNKTVFMSTGWALLDKFLGGGIAKGYSYIFSTGSGGGKTVWFTHMVNNMSVKQDHKGLWISTEEPQNEVCYRLISNFCNIPHEVIRHDVANECFKVPPHIQPKYDNLMEKLDKNLKIVQWKSQEYNLKIELRDEIKKYEKAMGHPPDYIVFDWIQPSAAALAGDGALRNVLKAKAYEMDEIAKQTGISICFAMQIGQVNNNKKFITPDCIDECKNAHQKAAAAICWSFLPNTDDSSAAAGSTIKDDQILMIGKTRFSAGGWTPIKRNFAVQRFEFK